LFILGFLLPIYAQELGASAANIGGLFAVFSLVMIGVRPLVGLAIDRYGRKSFLLMGLGAYMMAMGLFTLADSMVMLYMARLIQGVGAALTWIATYTIAAELAVSGRRGEALGEADGAGDRGAVYGAIIAFALLTWLPLRVGWMVVFTGYTGCALIGVWLAWRRVPETNHTIQAVSPSPSVREPVPSSPGRLARAFNLRRRMAIPSGLGPLLSIVLLTKASQALIKLLLLIFLRDRFALDIWQLAAAYLPATLILGFLPARMGRLSDRMGRTPLIMSGLVISAITSCFLPGLPALGWYMAVFVLNAVGVVMAMPALKALANDLVPREHWGRAFGFYTFTASVGTAIGPLVGGILYDQVSQSAPFYANALLLVISALWAMIAFRRSSSGSVTLTVKDEMARRCHLSWMRLRRVIALNLMTQSS
jgi:MFS family permease